MNNELRVLFWESTLKCNAYCSFCGSRCGDNESSDELTTQEICDVFKGISQKYDPGKIMINVSGGEPLVRKDLFEVMSYAASLGFSWGMVTNGILLNESVIAQLKSSGCKTISISIDGSEVTHETLRGVSGVYSEIINGIHRLKEADFLDSIMVTTVVSNANIEELDVIKNILLALPIDVWRICIVDPIGRAKENEKILLSPDQIKYVMDYIVTCRQENLPFNVTTSCSHFLGDYEFIARDYPFLCMAGKQVGSILANGDIFVCPNVPRERSLIQGNVRSDEFVEVWETKFSVFRDLEARKKGPCNSCTLYAKCQGDSLHTWDFENNEPLFCAKKNQLVNKTSVKAEVPLLAMGQLIAGYKKPDTKLTGFMIRPQSLAKDKVIVSPMATKDIKNIFDSLNQVEQIGVLLGNVYRNKDIEEEAFLIDIKKVVELKPDYATANKLIVNNAIYEQTELILRRYTDFEDKLCIVGYIHSHTNEINISMSLSDYQWHRNLYRMDWKKALSVIINPQKKMIAAYAGPCANHVEIQLLSFDT